MGALLPHFFVFLFFVPSPHSLVFPFSLSLARATEYGFLYVVLISFFCFFLCSAHFPDFPVSQVGRIYGSSETPRHFDELVKTSSPL